MTEEKGRESSIRHSYSLRSATSINSSELTSCSNTSYGTPGVSSDCTSDRPVSCQTTDGAKAQDVEQTTVIESSESKSDTKEEVSAGAELRGKRRRKKFVGVRQRPSGRWVAEIKDTTQKIRLWLGTFDTAEEAAHAYDEAACLLRGTNTRTNFVPHPSAKGSALASKVAQMIHLRRHPDPTASAFTSRSSASVPQQLLVESRSSSCENDAHSSCLSPSPPAPTSTHNTVSRCEEWINEYEARRKTALRKRILEDGNSVSRIRADAVPVADISFCNESVSSPIDAAFRRGSRFERRHLEQQEEGGDQAKGMIGAEPMAKDMQLSYSGEKLMSDEGLRFRRGSFMEAVLGVSDDFMSSSDIALAPYAMDLAYFGFGTGTESIPMQIDGFPLINELSKQMAEAEESFAESSGHSEESKMSYSEDVKRMRFERRNSASLYAMNGLHEILKHSSTPVPFSISSLSSTMVPSLNPLLSPPPPPYFLSSSSPWMPTPTLESSWKTNQTLAAPPLAPAGVSTPSGPVASMPTTSENLDPQEAMWNSWDLAPLCPLSVA